MKRFLLLLIVSCGPKGTPAPVPDRDPASDPASAPDPVSDPAPDPAPDPVAANAILAEHNRYRAKHCAPDLVWDDKLEKMAQAWADRCEFEHSRTKYGENLAAGTHGALPAERVVEMWYEEIAGYDFKRGGFSMETGHFTQVVWKGTTRLGCAMAACPQWDLWVCNYDPPGNVERGYGSNVLSTGCK